VVVARTADEMQEDVVADKYAPYPSNIMSHTVRIKTVPTRTYVMNNTHFPMLPF
jgi:hypothetical protein